MTDTPRGPPLAICYGTRPQTIKVSALIDALGDRWPLLTVDTGQHYDYAMNALLYEQLGVRAADVCLDVGSSDHATQTSAILVRAAHVFEERRPRAVVVVGDTNSTLGCALAAAKLRIPVVHVEAGLRAGDLMMAEEINRRVVDQISSVLCAPSAATEAQLHREHVPGLVVRSGDVARDVLVRHAGGQPTASALADWPLPPHEPFAFGTLHRAELVDAPGALADVIGALGRIGLPMVFGAHPRTRAALERSGHLTMLPANVHLCSPFGYLETLAIVRDARVVVTDSGGVQREAYWLGTPCVTVRGETEWGETLVEGANVLVPPEHVARDLPAAVAGQAAKRAAGAQWDRDALGDGHAAIRIREAIAPLV